MSKTGELAPVCRVASERSAPNFRVNNSKRVVSRVPSKWGRVLVQVALDQSFGASIMNCSYFTMHTVILAALTGNLFPLPELGSAVVDKVRWLIHPPHGRIFAEFSRRTAEFPVCHVGSTKYVFWRPGFGPPPPPSSAFVGHSVRVRRYTS